PAIATVVVTRRHGERATAKHSESGIVEHPLKVGFEFHDFGLAEAFEVPIHHRKSGLRELWINAATLGGELELCRAPVRGAAHAADQILLLEAVDHPGHRARIVRDAPAKTRCRISVTAGQKHE